MSPPADAAQALEEASNPGRFEWVLERFSEQPAAVGEYVLSPWFAVAGREWRLEVYPGGDQQEAAGHLSGKCSKCWVIQDTCSCLGNHLPHP